MAQKEDRFECEIDFSELNDYGPMCWLLRPCEWYSQEYQDCKSLRGRIHQYFVSGKLDNCDDWRNDYTSCMNFRKDHHIEHINRVIESELARKNKRMVQSKLNDVWEYRDAPPKDWNRPLPSNLNRFS